MNEEALEKTITSKRHSTLAEVEMHYGIKELKWISQKVKEILIDDDQDALCLKVDIGKMALVVMLVISLVFTAKLT